MTLTDIHGTTTLRNGIKMPYFGLGTFRLRQYHETEIAVTSAINTGYRLFDTASFYNNEKELGRAFRAASLPREQLFITSKVWNSDHGYENTIRAFDTSLERLGLDYLDLYLIHWPMAGKSHETWHALEALYQQGRVRAIGVSNFLQPQLEDLLAQNTIKPMINQLEFHPRLVQPILLDFCQTHHIQCESWSPLMNGRIFEIPLLQELASKYGKTIVQLVLRWNLQKNVVVIPKSSQPQRIRENANIFDFSILETDMARIDALDQGLRLGPNPNNFVF
ncbi:aldo/keto reductase [bacterium]|nr:aldo/keto reductase [bacterium]